MAYKPLTSTRDITKFVEICGSQSISLEAERRFPKLLHVVDLEYERSYYLDFFLVLLKLQGGPKSDEIWHSFRPRPNAAEYCNSEEKNLSTDGCCTRVPGLVNFGLQTPEIHVSYIKIL